MSSFRLSRAILAAGAIIVGAVLFLRPFGSLTALAVTLGLALAVLGVGELLRGSEQSSPTSSAAGCVMIATAMVTAAWPGLAIGGVGIIVAVGLGIYGLSRITDALRKTSANRVADWLLGFAGLSLAVVAVARPDVTLFSVCLVLGVALMWSGVAGLYYSFGRRAGILRPQAPRVVGAVIAVVVTIPLAVLSVQARQSVPTPDDFYYAAADGSPGTLLKADPFKGDFPGGARAWRILYTTEDQGGRPTVASGVVIASAEGRPGPTPVIAWAHPTTGVARGCAPSLLTRPFAGAQTPTLRRVLDAGWTVVATDYVGLGTQGPHPYLVGRSEGRSVLDAVRAARSIDKLELADQTVVWGHSQGGHAALWADLIAADYAPDVPLSGVVATAPMADLRALAQTLNSSTGHDVYGAYLIDSYSQVYDDVSSDDYLRLQSRLPMRNLADGCLVQSTVGNTLTTALAVGADPYANPLDGGALGRRLSENTPVGSTPTPLLILQGDDDDLVTPAAQTGYVDRRRAMGVEVDYRTYPRTDHDTLVAPGSRAVNDLIAWTQQRLE